MRFSKKTEYALRAVLILADHPPNQTLQIQELSSISGVSVKFLEQILLALKKEGILRSKRGVGGGYQLDLPARSITLGQVIRVMDGDLCNLSSTTTSHDTPAYAGSSGLQTRFSEIDTQINQVLNDTSLEEILSMDRPKDVLAFDI
ncbi:MAG: Rrf2 family transcriptional regulator [Verrucomicrobiales bacterium]|nr:Rrf2 family transcriptional regulator [Verrucomicrobiales bacterium]